MNIADRLEPDDLTPAQELDFCAWLLGLPAGRLTRLSLLGAGERSRLATRLTGDVAALIQEWQISLIPSPLSDYEQALEWLS